MEKGYAVVKKGESVRAGEVLISGIIPTELGGGFCYAKGTVLGRYSEKVSVSVENTVSEKVYLDERTVDRSLKIFSLNINIFKRYGHLPQNCDIIEAKEDITLYKRLPISFVRSIAKPYEIKTYGLSDEEMVLTASEQLSKKLVEFLSDKDVIRMRTSGGFFEGKYTMVCDTVVSCDITRIQEFDVNNG